MDYNHIVEALIAQEDTLKLSSIHSILLTHEQCLLVQNTLANEDTMHLRQFGFTNKVQSLKNISN